MPEENKSEPAKNSVKIPVNFGSPQPKPAITTAQLSMPPSAPNRTEQLLAEAAKEMDSDDDTPAPGKVHVGVAKKSHKKLFIFLLVLILIGAGAFWYLKIYKKPKANTNTQSTAQTKTVVKQSYEPDNVVYAFRASLNDIYSIYSRPTIGGERKEAAKLVKNTSANFSSVSGKVAAYESLNKIYLSEDSGLTFNKIIETDDTHPITGLAISVEGKRVAYSVANVNGSGKAGAIYSVDLKGNDKKTLHENDKVADFIIKWSEEKQKMIYWSQKYATDGVFQGLKMRDLKTSTDKDIAKNSDVSNIKFSDDFTSAVYFEATEDSSIKSTETYIGTYVAAPYKIYELNLTTDKITLVTSIGTKQEKNADGTEKFRKIYLGYLAGTNTPYFAEGLELNKIESSKTSLLFKSDKTIINVHYASDKNVITSTGESNNFVLSNYSLVDKKATSILSGDSNTVIFGITTK